MFKSVMDMFRTAPQQSTVPINADGSPVNPNAPAKPNSAEANPTVPSNSTITSNGNHPAFPAVKQGEESPLAGFKELWQIPVDKDGKPIPQTTETIAPKFVLDPTKLAENAKKLDFSQAVPAEMLDKASKGDTEAFKAVLNSVAQNAYANAAAFTAKSAEQLFEQQNKRFFEEFLPQFQHRQATQSATKESISIAENPAIAPMVEAVQEQLRRKFPTASPDEIVAKSKEFLELSAVAVVESMGKTVTAPTASPAKAKQSTDWEKYFSS